MRNESKEDTLLMFDLDGTLWDSAQSVAESWNEVFREADESLPELTEADVHGVMGLTMKEISQVLQRICGKRWRNCEPWGMSWRL